MIPMNTVRLGGTLLATAALTYSGWQMPAAAAGKPGAARSSAQKVSQKSVRLAVQGMH